MEVKIAFFIPFLDAEADILTCSKREMERKREEKREKEYKREKRKREEGKKRYFLLVYQSRKG